MPVSVPEISASLYAPTAFSPGSDVAENTPHNRTAAIPKASAADIPDCISFSSHQFHRKKTAHRFLFPDKFFSRHFYFPYNIPYSHPHSLCFPSFIPVSILFSYSLGFITEPLSFCIESLFIYISKVLKKKAPIYDKSCSDIFLNFFNCIFTNHPTYPHAGSSPSKYSRNFSLAS